MPGMCRAQQQAPVADGRVIAYDNREVRDIQL